MARKGARGRGWIRLMRVLTWVLFAAMLLVSIGVGIFFIGAGDMTQNLADQGALTLPATGDEQTDQIAQTAVRVLSGGRIVGIAYIALMLVFSLVFLGAMMVWLDMAENVRRISGRLSRRLYEEE